MLGPYSCQDVVVLGQVFGDEVSTVIAMVLICFMAVGIQQSRFRNRGHRKVKLCNAEPRTRSCIDFKNICRFQFGNSLGAEME